MGNEPLLSRAGIVALVTAVIAVLTSFGLPLTEAQIAAILGLVGVLAPVAVAVWARSHVTPTSKTE